MYATIRLYAGATDPSETGRRVNERFVPLISTIPGVRRFILGGRRGGVMISTSVFQDQSGAEESNRRAADYVRQNLPSLLPNPPQITRWRSCRVQSEIGYGSPGGNYEIQ
jgi:hypothetical protein